MASDRATSETLTEQYQTAHGVGTFIGILGWASELVGIIILVYAVLEGPAMLITLGISIGVGGLFLIVLGQTLQAIAEVAEQYGLPSLSDAVLGSVGAWLNDIELTPGGLKRQQEGQHGNGG